MGRTIKGTYASGGANHYVALQNQRVEVVNTGTSDLYLRINPMDPGTIATSDDYTVSPGGSFFRDNAGIYDLAITLASGGSFLVSDDPDTRRDGGPVPSGPVTTTVYPVREAVR